jgi:hypothetical protein
MEFARSGAAVSCASDGWVKRRPERGGVPWTTSHDRSDHPTPLETAWLGPPRPPVPSEKRHRDCPVGPGRDVVESNVVRTVVYREVMEQQRKGRQGGGAPVERKEPTW